MYISCEFHLKKKNIFQTQRSLHRRFFQRLRSVTRPFQPGSARAPHPDVEERREVRMDPPGGLGKKIMQCTYDICITYTYIYI